MIPRQKHKPHKPSFSIAEQERLRNLCNDGMNLTELELELRRSQTTIIRWAKKLNIPYVKRSGNQHTVSA